MKSSTLAAPIKSEQLVEYINSEVKFNYEIDDIRYEFKDELEALINEQLTGYGYIKLRSSFMYTICEAVFESTDTDEFSIDNAYAVKKIINNAIVNLAQLHGGYEAIKAD